MFLLIPTYSRILITQSIAHTSQPLRFSNVLATPKKKALHCCKALILLERETGLGPATLSLGS